MGHFIATRKSVDAESFAEQFVSDIIRLHGFPRRIISDRDSRFTSEFWKAVFKRCKVKLNFTTANQPTSDGKSENRIKTLRTMMRAFAAEYGEDWTRQLPMFEMIYNNSVNATTGKTPFELNYGYNPTTPLEILAGRNSKVESADDFVDHWKEVAEKAKIAIDTAQISQKEQADKHRRDIEFEEGERVLLSTKHIHQYSKKDPTFIGPYKIIKKYSAVTYKLELPDGMKLHPTFHISKLKKYIESPERFKSRIEPPPPPDLIDGFEEFEVEEIVNRRLRKRGKKQIVEYLIKWKGKPAYENTWEPESNLEHAHQAIKRYHTKAAHGH